ncbi:MAG: CPBP family intramembrane metalloprotease [Chitinivibrionales bacterium]|nr:CPBP family intramembrane metalloprotease [Chitinivibrionales bacterium]
MTRLLRITELLFLFVALPLAFALEPIPIPKIPSLLAVTTFCVAALLRDPSFDRRALADTGGLRRALPGIMVRAALAFVLLGTGVFVMRPSSLFGLVRRQPLVWGLVMLLYPLLSALPQELVYRTFFFHRYRGLFRRDVLTAGASAVAFAFLHVMYDNMIAVGLTLIGGALFSWTYTRTRSLWAATAEHALYGCIVFTVGLGYYFYEGH